MYGRIFEGLFTGSMRGSGPLAFAVWSYVIAYMREDESVGVQVELRPDLLAFYIGQTTPEEVQQTIDRLCDPDPESTCPDEDGRRLVSVGRFVYRVVSGPHYMKMRNLADLREYQRLAKRRQRAAKKKVNAAIPSFPTRAQELANKMRGDGDSNGADRLEDQEQQLNTP